MCRIGGGTVAASTTSRRTRIDTVFDTVPVTWARARCPAVPDGRGRRVGVGARQTFAESAGIGREPRHGSRRVGLDHDRALDRRRRRVLDVGNEATGALLGGGRGRQGGERVVEVARRSDGVLDFGDETG